VTQAFAVSDKGRVRKGNEDAFACADDVQLFVVADGMGGHNAGEVAARLAVEAIVGFIRRSAQDGECSWPCGVDPTVSFDGNRLRTAIHLANRRVFRVAEEHDDYTGMGTTVVAVLVSDSTIVVGHVGDSRLYLLADGILSQITKDDSWAATVLAEELGDDKVALANHPMRNVLTNVIGAREQADIHLVELPVQGDELLLLCSDGLHGTLSDEEICDILTAPGDVSLTPRALIDAALDAGSRDNVTALVVQLNGTGV